MGCTSSQIIYASPINHLYEPIKESKIYRAPEYIDNLYESCRKYPELRSIQDMILHSFKSFRFNKFLGTRLKNKDNNTFGKYEWKTYEQVHEICNQIGSAITRLNLAPTIKEYKDFELNFIAVYSKNREEYTILDLVCSLYGFILIPMYETLSENSLSYIFQQTGVSTAFCTSFQIDSLIRQSQEGLLAKLKNIVSFEDFTDLQKFEGKKAGLRLLNWAELLTEGIKEIQKYPKISPESIAIFSYTSAENPKAAMFTSRGLFLQIASGMSIPDLKLNQNDIYISILPLAYILERVMQGSVTYTGGAIGFYANDISNHKSDLKELKPTIIASFPMLLNKYYDAIQENTNKLTGLKKDFFIKATESKIEALKSDAVYTHKVWDQLVFRKMKQSLGDEVRLMISASAPIAEKTLEFLKIAFCCPIVEVYGQTESTGASHVTKIYDGRCGHVGGPLCGVEFKLVDVPEMHYTSKDRDSEDEPVLRGEVCIRGSTIFVGYYKEPQKTIEVIDSEGWLHTGDIGLIRKNGSLQIIDCKNNIFKLAITDEYVSPEKIENTYLRSKYIAEVFVYGDSSHQYLIGFFVPNMDLLNKLALSINFSGTMTELCENQQVKIKFLEEINASAKEEKLSFFELAKKIKLVPVLFGIKNLLTPLFKLKRYEAGIYFKQEIDKLYAEDL